MVAGHGNLVVTQMFVATQAIPISGAPLPLPASYAAWRDVRATAFDALDRKTASYEAAFGTQAKESLFYDGTSPIDGTSLAGLVREMDRPTGEAIKYRYDAVGRETNRDYAGGPLTTPAYSALYDENGNLTQRGTTALPNESLSYDALNRLTSDTEPQNSTHNTVSHTYYPNGWPLAVGLTTSSSITPAVYSLSYRADGKRQTLRLENNQRFAWTYSTAGRLASQRDPLTGTAINYGSGAQGPATLQPTAATYDASGRLASFTLPNGGVYSGFAYDGEDQVQAFAVNSTPITKGAEICLHTTARNEASKDQDIAFQSTGQPGPTPAYCTRYQTANANNMAAGARIYFSLSYDPRNAMMLSVPNSVLQYDTSGRQTVAQTQGKVALQYPQVGQGTVAAQRTQSFNADNHLTQTAITHWISDYYDGFWDNSQGLLYPPYAMPQQWPFVGTVSYQVGPSGHPLSMSAQDAVNGPYSASYTWDGDTVLLGSSGVNVDDLGLYSLTAHQMTYVYWRNWHGRLVGGHNAGCFDTWTETGLGAFHKGAPAIGSSSQGAPGDGQNSPLCEPLTQTAFTNVNGDGYDDGFNTFQGARTYDSGLQQWTTPDAYAGDVHDPMSQQPFMWNRNNPYEYADPAGYCANPGGPGVSICIDFYISAQKALGLRGDNRGTSGTFTPESDRYRVRVMINFASRAGTVEVADSHTAIGNIDLGPGHDHGSTVKVEENVARVHINASCAVCPSVPAIHGDLTLTLHNGHVSVAGSRGDFPATEVYQYQNGKPNLILNQNESPDVSGLFRTTAVPRQ